MPDSQNLQPEDPNLRSALPTTETEEDFSVPTPPVPRPFPTCFDPAFFEGYHKGTMAYTYRDIPCLKDPIDLALYMKLIWELKPGSIIEIGSFQGGSAIFYADLCQTYGLSTDIVTVDFQAIQQGVDPSLSLESMS
jgi:cephalosporin hydroxylase